MSKLPAQASNATLSVFIVGIWVVLHLSGCTLHPAGSAYSTFETTYGKHLLLAEAGDAESQNLVGFMLFHGEGVHVDRRSAETWFRLAAEQGNLKAQRNLEILSSMGSSAYEPVAVREAAAISAEHAPRGERLYAKFCAGCHGFNGVSSYVHSPSFALGQALHKSDAVLLRSVLDGKGEMPNWDDKLSRAELEDVLRFVRTLASRYELGIAQRLRGPPPLYFLFGPMKSEGGTDHAPVR